MKRILASIALAIATALGMTCANQSSRVASAPAKAEATAAANDDLAANTAAVEQSAAAVSLDQPIVYTDGLEFELPKMVAASKPAHDSLPAPTRVYAPAVPSGRYELRSVKVGPFRRENQWVWVSNQPQTYQQQTFGGCSGGRCGW